MINFDDLLIAEARKWVGVRETGWNKGKEVEMFQKFVDGKAQGEAYCMAFVQYCVGQVERETLRKSWLFKSEHCLTTWTKTPLKARLKEPEPGSIVIWQYYTVKGVATGSGHTGIVTQIKNDISFLTIEGNTGSGAEIIREGDGVWERERRIAKLGRFRLMGFLRPWLVDPV